MSRETRVECHSGYTYAQRPKAFEWQEERLEVHIIRATWLLPEGRRFRVHTEDGRAFDLTYLEEEDTWTVGKPK